MKKGFLLLLLTIQCFALSAQDGVVVLIHGFMTSGRSMKPIENSLREFGFCVHNWEYQSRRRTIQQHACTLAWYLQYVASCHPGQPIDFVAHSTGGLILRAALNLPDCPEEAKIGRAVLLATPNQGSRLAIRFQDVQPIEFFMGKKSGWQLMHWNECDIQNCLGSFPPSVEVLVVAGTRGNQIFFDMPNDGYLAIDETALDTPHYWTSYNVTHGEILTSRKVLCCLRTFLYWGYEEPPGSAQYEPGCQ